MWSGRSGGRCCMAYLVFDGPRGGSGIPASAQLLKRFRGVPRCRKSLFVCLRFSRAQLFESPLIYDGAVGFVERRLAVLGFLAFGCILSVGAIVGAPEVAPRNRRDHVQIVLVASCELSALCHPISRHPWYVAFVCGGAQRSVLVIDVISCLHVWCSCTQEMTSNLLAALKSNQGKSNQVVVNPLIEAAKSGNQEGCAKALEEPKTKVDQKDPEGLSALMYAASNGYMNVVKFLVEKGARISAKDDGGETALMKACKEGHQEVNCSHREL